MKFEAKSLIDKIMVIFTVELFGVILTLGFVSAGIAFIPFEKDWSIQAVLLLLLTGIIISSLLKSSAEEIIFGYHSAIRLCTGWCINIVVLDIMIIYIAQSLGVVSDLSVLIMCFSIIYTLVYAVINYCIFVGKGIKLKDIKWK